MMNKEAKEAAIRAFRRSQNPPKLSPLKQGRTLFVENCPKESSPKFIAEFALPRAFETSSEKIVVFKGPFRYEFDTLSLFKNFKSAWAFGLNLFGDEIEYAVPGSFHDTMKGVFQVPRGFPQKAASP